MSPLLDARFARAVLDLAARGFDVVVVAVSSLALTRSTVPASAIVDLACRLWRLERRATLAGLRSAGLTVLEWEPTEPLELAVARVRRRRRQRPRVG